MAVTSLSEWSTTTGSNTELNGISLAENVMRPPAVNNAFREMMAQVAAYSRRGTDLATASTLNLDSVDTDFLDLTGTTTVTAVTLTDTHSRRARAVGAFQLTASASLVVNGSTSANYTTTAGDLLFFEGYSGGVVRVWTVSGGGATAASTTDVLTGTNAVKSVTADALAALWEKGSDEASAGTVSFGEGGFFHVTGTTTITDIDFDTAKDGRAVDVVFDGALTLTHNGTTLQLPGGASITTAAGDRARFVQDNSDNVICLWYQRAGALNTGITLGTAVASTSGTAIDFTGIPAWARRITVMFSGISTSGTSVVIVQIGDSGGIGNTGYLGGASTNGGGTVINSTTGFALSANIAGASVYHGAMTLTLENSSSNTWIASGTGQLSSAATSYTNAGSKSLSATLDRVRITPTNGTDTFDAGEINITYE